MIELAFFLLLNPSISITLPAPQPQQSHHHAPARLRAPLRCDDGHAIFEPDGSPNWDCELQGCSPHEALCWSDRLDHCYDENGDENGMCGGKKVTPCNSRWECFKSWANCTGEHTCDDTSGWLGCPKGACTTNEAPVSPSPPGAASPASAKPPPKPPAKPPAQIRSSPRAPSPSPRGDAYHKRAASQGRDLPAVRTRGSVGGHGDV